jgi:hypothetical protein
MSEIQRSKKDRRSGEDRRKRNVPVKVDRRKGGERRTRVERRGGWVRVSEWKSVWVEVEDSEED